MTDRELLELIAAQVGILTNQSDNVTNQVSNLTNQVGNLTNRVDNLTNQVDNLTNQVEEVKAEVRSTKQTVIRIENDHGKKLTALYDGYQQMNQRLDRIEQEVARHEEIIWKRVK